MFERGISETVVRAVIVIDLGEVIQEYLDDVPYPSRLILGWSREQPIHVVTAYDSQERMDIVITVYEPDHLRWEDGFKKRKLI
ncbi:conserved hypothetical protein [Candidatus Nitrotoga sp. BS]|nr:conserved hypothetical protein [Candidatus Nitrotoga sp. BS]